MAEILTHERFGGDDLVKSLHEMGVVSIDRHLSADEVTVPDVAYGELEVGVMTEDERAVFLDIYHQITALNVLRRQQAAAQFTEVAAALNDEGNTQSPQELLALVEVNEEAVFEAARMERRLEFLQAMLNWMICNRLDIYTKPYAIRTKCRIVVASEVTE